jgi:hypothetical protein
VKSAEQLGKSKMFLNKRYTDYREQILQTLEHRTDAQVSHYSTGLLEMCIYCVLFGFVRKEMHRFLTPVGTVKLIRQLTFKRRNGDRFI